VHDSIRRSDLLLRSALCGSPGAPEVYQLAHSARLTQERKYSATNRVNVSGSTLA
jgi:hypothetical protein